MEILLYLVIGLAVGLGIGWFIWGLAAQRDLSEARAEATAAVHRARAESTGDGSAGTISALENKLSDCNAARAGLESGLEEARATAASLEAELSQSRAEADRARADLAQAAPAGEGDRVRELEAQLMTCTEARSSAEARLADLAQSTAREVEEPDTDPETLRQAEAHVRKLEAQLEACTEARSGLEAKLADLQHDTAHLAPAASAPAPAPATEAPPPEALFTERPAEVDDLKRVKGVGPKMERVLNDKGIYQFRQLANFTARDIEWVNAAIGAFPGRIERDDWVGQAQALYREKYGKAHDAG